MKYQEKVVQIEKNIEKVIVGKKDVIELVMTAALAGGHILLEDVPGTGKTMLSKTFAASVDAQFKRIQFTPDLLPSDITGINYYNQKEKEFVFREGPLFGNVILADEINRATPRTQSALLECMEEKQITVDSKTYQLPEFFMVLATQNPIETVGTYQLPEAQSDRFIMKVNMGYPSKEDELEILKKFLKESPYELINSVCSKEDIIEMKNEVKQVFVHESIMDYIIQIAVATRNASDILIGVSPRGCISMVNAARAYAYIHGRDYVIPEDIKELAVYVFAHRIVMKHGISGNKSSQAVIESIVSSVNVPTEDWTK